MLQFFLRRLRNERGFTLIELLIVVAIIAILAAILIPNFLRARAQSQVAATKGNLKNVATALESYQVDNASYPAAYNSLVTGNYTRALPTDPCSGSLFGASPGYTYTPIPATLPTDYQLKTNWGTTSGTTGYQCYNANQNSNISYTPGGGLSQTP